VARLVVRHNRPSNYCRQCGRLVPVSENRLSKGILGVCQGCGSDFLWHRKTFRDSRGLYVPSSRTEWVDALYKSCAPLEKAGVQKPRIKKPKANFGAIPPGARWVTVHPWGAGGEGLPVLIAPRGDGQWTIVGAPGTTGEHAVLSNVKSKEEYAAGQAQKNEAIDPEARKAARLEAAAKSKQRGDLFNEYRKRVQTIVGVEGLWSPTFLSHLEHVARRAQEAQTGIKSKEERDKETQAKLDTIGEGTAETAAEKKQAAENQKILDDFKAQTGIDLTDPDQLKEHWTDLTPQQQEAAMGLLPQGARDAMKQEMAEAQKRMEDINASATAQVAEGVIGELAHRRPTMEGIPTLTPEQAEELVKTSIQYRTAMSELRRKPSGPIGLDTAIGVELTEDDVKALAVEAQLDAQRTAANLSFYDNVNHAGKAATKAEFRAGQNALIGLTFHATGLDLVNPDMVALLGLEGAATVMAEVIKEVNPEVAKKLSKEIDGAIRTEAPQLLEQAEQRASQVLGYLQGLKEAVNEGVVGRVTGGGYGLRLRQTVADIYGSAAGSLRAGAALGMALRSEKMIPHIELKVSDAAAGADKAALLQLAEAEYEIVKQKDQTYLRIDRNAFARLISKPDGIWQADPEVAAIKRGPVPDTKPQGLKEGVKLNDTQKRAVAFALKEKRVLEALGTGTGKTLTAISTITELHAQGKANRVLLVVPANLQDQWASEIAKFADLPEDMPIHRIGDMSGSKRRQAWESGADGIYLVSHDLIARDKGSITTHDWDAVVADEAHMLTGGGEAERGGSQRAKAVEEIQAPYMLGMTASPIRNNMSELWRLGHWLNPAKTGTLKSWMDRFSGINLGTAAWQDYSLEAFRQMTDQWVMHSTKDLDIEVGREQVQVPMSQAQKQLYGQEEREYETMRDSEDQYQRQASAANRDQAHYLTTHDRDWKTCAHALAFKGMVDHIAETDPSGKMIIFANGLASLDTLKTMLEETGHKPITIKGEVSMRDPRVLARPDSTCSRPLMCSTTTCQIPMRR
jgi:hypothetical protein